MAPKTHQNVRNNQSYTFLNSPAMIVEGHAAVERAGSAEGKELGGTKLGRASGLKSRAGDFAG